MAVQTAKINYTAAELEAAIEIIQNLLSVGSDNYVTIKTGSVEVKVPTEDLISSLSSSWSQAIGNIESAVGGLETAVGNVETAVGQLESTVGTHTTEINSLKSNKMDNTTFKTINNETITGSGNITVTPGLRYEVE